MDIGSKHSMVSDHSEQASANESSAVDRSDPAQPANAPSISLDIDAHSIHPNPTDDLDQLLDILPPILRDLLRQHPNRQTLVEVVLDLGRLPEARFFGAVEYLAETPITHADLEHCIQRVGAFGGESSRN
jgi:hypothetical protein